jgi:hypothetical protein
MIKIKRSSNLRKVFILSASFLLAFYSCRQDEEKLKPDFVKNIAYTQFNNQTEIQTKTLRSDSILADRVAQGLAGIYRDSVFGLSRAALHVQPRLATNFLTLGQAGETLVTDSLVLSLQYNGIYGDSSIQQTLEVYRIDEVLDISENYPSNTVIETQAAVLGTKTFRPDLENELRINSPNSTGGMDTLNVQPELRIRLDNAFGDEILSKSGQSELENNSNFAAFFNGLKVMPPQGTVVNNNEAAILYFALTASATKMSLYYSTISTNGDTTKRVIAFPINSSSVRFNTFEHDYSGSEVESQLNQATADSVYTYTQAMAGVETLISFPSLVEKYKDSNIVVNKAELVLPTADGSYAKYGFASSLIVASKDDMGNLEFIPDYFEGESYFGGFYDPITQSYRFNVGRYVQGLLNGTINSDGLTLLLTGSAVKAERAVIFGPKNLNRQIRLNLYYSKTG